MFGNYKGININKLECKFAHILFHFLHDIGININKLECK